MQIKVTNKGQDNYELLIDAPPEFINEISIYLFLQWVFFAEGKLTLGGRKLEYPTGKYAASIKKTSQGQSSVLIFADTSKAPEGKWLSLGHGRIDLKQSLTWGKSYPMHRFAHVYTGHSPPVPNSKKQSADAWVIPEMKAYEPVKYLTELAVKYANS